MPHPVVTIDNLTTALDGLVDRVPGAECAVVLSPDGLLLAQSRDVADELAAQVSSLVSGVYALGQAAGRVCGAGILRQVVVQMSRAFVFVAATRGGAILTVRMGGDSDVGELAYEVALFAAQAERDLPVYLEPARLATGGDRGADDRRS
ncbi:Predicted regulator of Ras-like GTPase activity, Roadblock/LC7/MglB family [Micromonospora viridifaciens]|uniref:Predicted regulator of Ras-like GTPase activity, Roadblock/LC7/MglB family n=1 Tax=Micromonospora viridifaciens TaxID=1881 RepID=A0A1C4ZYA4_MICVI|nr:roadblock/LC7 domain-containing protein [Micromonospora viridifaciens]SCF37938.1 Predicted regulator of Ras-like GTPase activity, Roadblock/LC7/MglB family [Micromonospora viridifaciens]